MTNNLAISTWNIHGLSHKVLGDKTTNEDFLLTTSNIDILLLTETWSHIDNDINIPGFKAFVSEITVPNTNRASRLSGGLALLIKTKLENHISIVKKTNNTIWCKISKEILNTEQNLYLGGIYIPPEKSNYFDNEIFDQLELDINSFQMKGNVIIFGDFNARTGILNDFVSKDGHKFINDTSNYSFQPKSRQTFDTTINNHGKQLINICKTTDLRILNGRTKGDSFGKPTFHGKNGISVVDYIICDQNTFQNIKHFIVKPPNYLSDHSQITTWIEINNPIPPPENITNSIPIHKLPFQFVWSDNSKNEFKKAFESNDIQQKYKNFLNTDFTNEPNGASKCATELENIITLASKKSLKIKKKKNRPKINNVTNKKWFDKECRIKRHELRKLANKKHRDPTNLQLREAYHTMLKTYKETLQMKKNKFHEDKIDEIEKAATEKDSKNFWKTLKTISEDLETDQKMKNIPSDNNLFEHFKNLHSKHDLKDQQKQIQETLTDMENNKDLYNELDQVITDSEIKNAAKKLKNKKASYSDRVSNEMIKSSISPLSNGFIKVFNTILSSGKLPKTWCEGLITPIFKSGDRLDPNNYRGICVTSCLGKLLNLILNERLMCFIKDKNLIHPSQIGFMPGCRTADHIFTLKTLHDKYVNDQNNGKIYACFVDFKKAFDSVWHDSLLLKLLQNKIGERFYDLIKTCTQIHNVQ